MNNTDHIIKSYDDELARLVGEIARMGELAAAQLQAAMALVGHRDDDEATRIIEADDAIDALEQAIGHDVVRLLALRAPMARDLREVFATLRIASDIERIGDYAANVAKRSMALPADSPPTPIHRLHDLCDLAVDAVREALQAYSTRDSARARRVWADDERLDQAYTELFRDLLARMMDDPRCITSCTHLLFMAKNIERVGDHATNIAESIWYAVEGEPLRAPRRKADTSTDPAP